MFVGVTAFKTLLIYKYYGKIMGILWKDIGIAKISKENKSGKRKRRVKSDFQLLITVCKYLPK